MEANNIIEAILFASSRPVSEQELLSAGIKKSQLKKGLNELIKRYKNSSIEIVEINEKYVMQLRSTYAENVKKFAPMELSSSLLKTLSIMAYHQPVKQSELKGIIGSQIYEHVKELSKKGFLKTKKCGRTKIIEMSAYFYKYFGFNEDNIDQMKKALLKRIESEK